MRSANLIGQERSSDRIDLYFIFQWTRSVFMRGGAIHDRTTFVTLWRETDSLQLLTLYLTLTCTPIFSGRGAKINLHTTPKLTVVMPISCLLPFADPGISSGGGGSTSIWQKCSDNVVFWGVFFFAFFLVLGLFYRSQMVSFIEKYHFSRFRRGSKFFQCVCVGGGGTFSRGGVQLLIPYRNPYNLWFPRGSGPPVPPPLDPHLAAIYLVSQSAKWCDRLLHLCLFSCNFFVCFQSSSTIKSFLELTAWLLPGLSNIFCNSSLLSSITQ